MSAVPGIFILKKLNNEQDKLLLAPEKLYKRLAEIKKQKTNKLFEFLRTQKKQISATTRDELTSPTLDDVRKTHRTFLTMEYKPYVAFGKCYQKILAENSASSFTTESKSTLRFVIENFGQFVSDMCVHIKLQAIGENGGNIRYKYCDFPGVKLCKETSFEVDRMPIDRYSNIEAIMKQNYEVRDYMGFCRCVGHSQSIEAICYDSDNQVDEIRMIKNGYQTLKSRQGELDLWIPLMFHMNMDPNSPFPMFRARTRQKAISIVLCDFNEFVGAFNENDERIAFPGGKLNILACELYVNNIFFDQQIADIYKHSINQIIFTQHRKMSTMTNKTEGSFSLAELKLPIEHIYFGFMPVENKTTLEHWYKFARINTEHINAVTTIDNSPDPPKLITKQLRYYTMSNIANLISFKADKIDFLKDYPFAFLTSYLPHINNKHGRINSPTDSGLALLSFAHMIDDTDVYGYINGANVKEFYLEWKDCNTSIQSPVELVLSAKIVNSLEMTGKTAYIRFA